MVRTNGDAIHQSLKTPHNVLYTPATPDDCRLHKLLLKIDHAARIASLKHAFAIVTYPQQYMDR